ncbi:MAG TPA: gfo/Idh/MocA family oxidoreductase, partial [Isosphaeraceae bacterium]
YGHRLSSVGHLGNIALRTGESLRWDAHAERVTNHEEANRHLAREAYRAPWSLPEV